MRLFNLFRFKPKPIVIIRIPLNPEIDPEMVRDNIKKQLPDYSVCVIATVGLSDIDVIAMTHKDYKIRNL